MSIHRYATRQDGNHRAIVNALRAGGAVVYEIRRPVDILIGYAGKTALAEIKDLSTGYGRKGLNDNQKSFLETWNGGTFATITDTEGAARLLALMGAE
jgi:hypothetical protein